MNALEKLGLKTLHDKGVTYVISFLFNLILNVGEHRIRYLLPAKVTCDRSNFRNDKLFHISKYRKSRFRDAFIISSLK